jgi:hypothetical protein
MSTLVFHSSALGVTEYTTSSTGLAGDFECDATGLFRVDDEQTSDDGELIVSQARLGVEAEGSRLQKYPDRMYVQMDGTGKLQVTVATTTAQYTYNEDIRRNRNRRFIFGRGIRDSYLGYVLTNPDGKPFTIDAIEFGDRHSVQRKV